MLLSEELPPLHPSELDRLQMFIYLFEWSWYSTMSGSARHHYADDYLLHDIPFLVTPERARELDEFAQRIIWTT